ncbi:DUF4097 family beta strand repeat-containing protein [Bacteroidota bacterium]
MKKMKNNKISVSVILAILISIFISGNLFAQRIVEQKSVINLKQEILLNFQFADKINVTTWNGDEIKIKATVDIDNNKHNDAFSFQIEKKSDKITIKSEIEDLAELSLLNRKKDENFEIHCDFEVIIPVKMALSIKTINGNIVVGGNYRSLCLKSISGDVEVECKFNSLHMNSISGDVDLSVSDNIEADFNMSTLTGDVYSDLEFGESTKKKSSYWTIGHKINKKYNGGGINVTMGSISGNVYLRETK